MANSIEMTTLSIGGKAVTPPAMLPQKHATKEGREFQDWGAIIGGAVVGALGVALVIETLVLGGAVPNLSNAQAGVLMTAFLVGVGGTVVGVGVTTNSTYDLMERGEVYKRIKELQIEDGTISAAKAKLIIKLFNDAKEVGITDDELLLKEQEKLFTAKQALGQFVLAKQGIEHAKKEAMLKAINETKYDVIAELVN